MWPYPSFSIGHPGRLRARQSSSAPSWPNSFTDRSSSDREQCSDIKASMKWGQHAPVNPLSKKLQRQKKYGCKSMIHHTISVFYLGVKGFWWVILSVLFKVSSSQTYLRLCSLQSGCCRDLHKASAPLSPILFCVRFTILNSDWPELKAADNASIDAADKSQLCSL